MRRVSGVISFLLVIVMLISNSFTTLAELVPDHEEKNEAETDIDTDAEPDDMLYTDIAGHWAEETLKKAVIDGILSGTQNQLNPNGNITTIQALAIFCRILGAEMQADISGSALSDTAWYYEYASKSLHLGLIKSVDITGFNSVLSRQDAFSLIAKAFAITEAAPDLTVLEQFSDHIHVSAANRPAVATLVSRELIAGSEGNLNPNRNTSRAEFVTMIYRIISDIAKPSDLSGDYSYGVLVRGSAEINGNNFTRGVWFDCGAADINLSRTNADEVVIRSHSLSSLRFGANAKITRLVLAAQAGDISISPTRTDIIDTLIVAEGGGQITARNIDTIEITGDKRNITVHGNVKNIIISGRDNTVLIPSGITVDSVVIAKNANDNTLLINGTVNELETMGLRGTIEGDGRVRALTLALAYTQVNIRYDILNDAIDHGLTDAGIRIDMPERLPVATRLNASAIIEDALPGKECDIIWLMNGNTVSQGKLTTGENTPVFTHNFTYSFNMATSALIKVIVRYETAHGEQQELSAEKTIILENYNKQHWTKEEAPRVLRAVTNEYKGDFTLEWAQANDYTDFDKEVWVNAKGYSSESKYLVWINITYQRVNIFEGSTGNWDLTKTFIVATGSPRNPTRKGVTTVTAKQRAGWTTSTYTVRPVVRFFPGSGYAFHSRLYKPRTDVLNDDRIGYPVSLGCIRMYDEDIWYIFNNIPEGSTVVVH